MSATYVVTGSTSGIGLECTRILLQQGAQVVSLCRNEDKARALFGLELSAGQLIVYQHDFAHNEQLYARCLQLLKPYRVSGLIHCVGQSLVKRLLKTDYAHALQLFEVNFCSFSELCRALLRLRAPEQELSLLAISSMAALRPTPETPLYGCVKALLNQYIQGLAAEFAAVRPHLPEATPLERAQRGHLVRVNAVAPGRVATPMIAPTLMAVQAGQLEVTLLPPAAVAQLALATLHNRYLTGQIIALDNN